DYTHFYQLSHSELVGIEKVAVSSSLRSLKLKVDPHGFEGIYKDGRGAIFQTDDLDAFDSKCDEAPSASIVLITKLSAYDLDVLSEESKAKEDKYVEEIIGLENKNKALNNVVYKIAQRKVHALYCGRTIIKQHDALSIIDTEETLELAEESRLKMHAKQNDQITKEKKVNISLIDFVALNKLSEHFVKHFVPEKQLYVEQAFWLPISKPVFKTPLVQHEPVLKEIPHELPTQQPDNQSTMAVNGGQRRSTMADHREPPPDHRSTVVDRQSTVGSTGDSAGVVDRPRGTTQVVTRGILMIELQSEMPTWRCLIGGPGHLLAVTWEDACSGSEAND
nr:hypothetical protein [Tanacetum cinerariifolium]